MIHIAVCEDKRQKREIWLRCLASLNREDVRTFAPEVSSTDDFLTEMRSYIEGEDVVGFDGVILDMQFSDDDRGGMLLWQSLVSEYGRDSLGELLVATKFAENDIAVFADKFDGSLLTSQSATHRAKALYDFMAAIDSHT